MEAFGVWLTMDEEGRRCGIVVQVGVKKCRFEDACQVKAMAADLVSKEGRSVLETECLKMLQAMIEAAATTFDRITRPVSNH